MKASVLYGIGDLRYVDIPKPEIKDNEVLVNVMACGICGSDINRVLKTGTYHFPTVIGHEFSGVVVKTTDNTRQLLGKRVGVFPLKPCFECNQCKDGKYEMCSNYDYLGSRCDGGFEEYVAVPVWNLIELPDSVSFEEAAMLEPTSVAIHALRRIEDIKNKSIAIIGPGPIGNILCKIAKILGASKVILIGRTSQKLEFAKEYSDIFTINSRKENVTEVINDLTNGIGVDIAIEGTGAEESVINSIMVAKPEGQIILMGNPKGDITLSQKIYWQILRKQLCLRGTWNSSFGTSKDDWRYAIDLIASGKLQLSPLISHKLKFSELLNGIQIMNDPVIFSNKVMLINDETSR